MEPKLTLPVVFIVPKPSPGASVPLTVVAAPSVPRPPSVAPLATVIAPELCAPLMTSLPALTVVAPVKALAPFKVQVPASFFDTVPSVFGDVPSRMPPLITPLPAPRKSRVRPVKFGATLP